MRPTIIAPLAALLLLTVAFASSCKEEPAGFAEAPNVATVDDSFDARFVGKWEIKKWGVAYEVEKASRTIRVSGADVANTEDFEVSEVKWDGAAKALQATFRMPSTNHKTHSVLKLLDDDRIEDKYTGSASGEDIWARVKK